MEKTYFVKLKPLNSFYFGSIKEFGNKNDEYFLKSATYPQQTAVLGMLRKKILEDNGLLLPQELRTKEHRDKEKEYIGEIKPNFQESKLGKIKKVTDVQIYLNDDMYVLAYDKQSFTEQFHCTSKGRKKLYKYDAKNFQCKIRDLNNLEKILELKESVEVGINSFKRKNYNDEEKAFFKKSRYKLEDRGAYFGFYVTLDENVKLENGIVQLGDRHSVFSFEIEEKKEEKVNYKNLVDNNVIFFLSDFYIDNDDLDLILEKSNGILIQNTKFKFIARDDKNQRQKVDLKNLISRGSIILLDENKEILDILNNKKYTIYEKIGFNKFIIGGEI